MNKFLLDKIKHYKEAYGGWTQGEGKNRTVANKNRLHKQQPQCISFFCFSDREKTLMWESGYAS